ncbi:hypothetical protein ACFQS7_27550 [Dankookia sp. GCM10030260]|uniref:hypothetical protein n=1 Tax=Dankookia sp. GCM10030260 TaxID=3273390 RepID=UPI00360AEF9C
MPNRRLLTAALLLAPGMAGAQRAPTRGPNGGLMVLAEGHPIELVVADLAVTVFLNGENGRPAPSRGASGRVVVQAGGQTTTVSLTPAEPNRLVGQLGAPLAAGARVLFTGAMADGHRIQARFAAE